MTLKKTFSFFVALLVICCLICSCSNETVQDEASESYFESETEYSEETVHVSTDETEEVTSTTEKTAEITTEKTKESTSEYTGEAEILAVNFFDVGQGDSEFIQFPNGENMLIDAGEKEESSTVISNLKNLGVSEITYIVATHPHSDHIGGLSGVIDAFDVDTVYMPNAAATTSVYDNLLTAIENKGCNVIEAKNGVTVIDEDNLDAYFIAPFGDDYSNLNNYSAVMKLTYGNVSYLFMGDAEETIEEQITADVSADVVKVGHHGASTSSSSSFVSRVSAKYAVFEVGAGNSYGHPTEQAISNWESVGATILRTDLNSNIIISTDGKDITVLTDVDYSTLDQTNIFTGETNKKNTTTSESKTTVLSKNSTTTRKSTTAASTDGEYKWVLNTSSKKIHKPDCSSVKKISESNYKTSNKSISELEKEGYTTCQICNPGG